jgi:membrane protein
LKLAFAIFVARISSYNTIYGALAGIPIVLLWMYIFWAVVLFGAEIAAGLGQRWGDEGEAPRFGARHVGVALPADRSPAEGDQKVGLLTVSVPDTEHPRAEPASGGPSSPQDGQDGERR